MPKIDVLLINSPIRLEAEPNCIPYGLATIAAVLRDAGCSVEILDLNALRPTREAILEMLRSRRFDVVGLSGLITTYQFQKWLSAHLRQMHPQALIVSGGGLATSCPELLLQQTPVDIAVRGEGEITLLEICSAIARNKSWDDIPGIVYRRGGALQANPDRINVPDLDTIPLPAWDLLPMEIYLRNPIWGNTANNSSGFKQGVGVTRSMNIIGSRGCPHGCRYCYNLFGQSSYRFRSAQNIVSEIGALVTRYGVDFIGFVDDNMMASQRRLLEFCELMAREKFPVTWGCHGRVTNAEPAILEKMAAAGCVWIGYGIESGSQTILNAMNKRATVDQAHQAIMITRAAGIFANTTFIFGYPGESRATIQKTIDFKRALDIDCGSFYATPYPGTRLYEQARHKILDEEAYVTSLGNATQFTINLTDFSDNELHVLKNAMDANIDVLSRGQRNGINPLNFAQA